MSWRSIKMLCSYTATTVLMPKSHHLWNLLSALKRIFSVYSAVSKRRRREPVAAASTELMTERMGLRIRFHAEMSASLSLTIQSVVRHCQPKGYGKDEGWKQNKKKIDIIIIFFFLQPVPSYSILSSVVGDQWKKEWRKNIENDGRQTVA